MKETSLKQHIALRRLILSNISVTSAWKELFTFPISDNSLSQDQIRRKKKDVEERV